MGGRVLVGGSDTADPKLLLEIRRRTGMVFQNPDNQIVATVVEEDVAFAPENLGCPPDEIRMRVDNALKTVGMYEYRLHAPHLLSGGQKQRVAIARALINDPSVLLLDEPLSALDAKLRQHMLIELDQIHDRVGITFIYVTHDQEEALSVSDRIAVMNKGHVLQVGTPHEIYESPATNFVARFIGETNLYDATISKIEKIEKSDIEEYMVDLDIAELGNVKVTTVDTFEVGQKVSFTIRPEKVLISKDKPSTTREDINLFQGNVDEPIYSGFQTKFYVNVNDKTLVRIVKQHAKYNDDGPEIEWKDDVYISFSANDGYIVGIKES
jgi:spermidine/putrescine transport system ATP-binding protein